jgi:alkylation response protein AidB-like acyl-CoA dehydrogenase
MPSDVSFDQEYWRDVTRKFLETTSPLTAVRALEEDPDGFSRHWWVDAAELGWTSLLVPEDLGGGSLSGQGLLELTIVAEEMGRMVAPGPLIPVNVAALAIAQQGRPEQIDLLLPGILSGTLVATWCAWEPDTPSRAAAVRAVPDGGGFRLQGTTSPVEAAGQADWLLVAADAPSGPTEVLVRADTPGLKITSLDGIDLVRRFGGVEFDDVFVEPDDVLGLVGGAAAAIERQAQVAIVLQTAETMGVTQRVFDFTLDYMFDRHSFGRQLASYQALKHRFADMKMWLEAGHAAAGAGAVAVQEQTADAAELVSVAKSYIGDHATALIQECVQMHGGMGVTWDHDLHLYLRRATLNRFIYGSPEAHRERIATLLDV